MTTMNNNNNNNNNNNKTREEEKEAEVLDCIERAIELLTRSFIYTSAESSHKCVIIEGTTIDVDDDESFLLKRRREEYLVVRFSKKKKNSNNNNSNSNSNEVEENENVYRWKGNPLENRKSFVRFCSALSREKLPIIILLRERRYKTKTMKELIRFMEVYAHLSNEGIRCAVVIANDDEKKIEESSSIKRNNERHRLYRWRGNDGFMFGCSAKAVHDSWGEEMRRLYKKVTEFVDGEYYERDETCVMLLNNNMNMKKTNIELYQNICLDVPEQLQEVSQDIVNLIRSRIKERDNDNYDDNNACYKVAISTRERFDMFKQWHYVETLPSLYGVYLEIQIGNELDTTPIAYISFHTEEAPPNFKCVASSVDMSVAQEFAVVDRLVVNPEYRKKGLKELLLKIGCDAFHERGIPCRIKTSSSSASSALNKCKEILAFEKFKTSKDTGKEKSSGRRMIIVNVPAQQSHKASNTSCDKGEGKDMRKDVARWLNALSPDTCDKLTPKIRTIFDNITNDEDRVFVSEFALRLISMSPIFRKLISACVKGTRLECFLRERLAEEIKKLSTTEENAAALLSEEERSARKRFLCAFLENINDIGDSSYSLSSSSFLFTKENACALSRQQVFDEFKQELKNIRIVDEDKSLASHAAVKRGQRAGWSFFYVGSPLIRRDDKRKFMFDSSSNAFIEIHY
jgi:hypothetical protein